MFQMSCLRYSSLVWDLPSSLHDPPCSTCSKKGKFQNCMAVEAMGGCGLCLAPLLRPSIVHGTRRLAMGHSLPVKYSPAAVLGITLSLGARLTLQHWMYFSHHQHAQEAPCSVLVLTPKRSAVQRGVIQEFVGARTSW